MKLLAAIKFHWNQPQSLTKSISTLGGFTPREKSAPFFFFRFLNCEQLSKKSFLFFLVLIIKLSNSWKRFGYKLKVVIDVDWNGFTRIFIKELKLKRKINVKLQSPAAWESKRKKMTGFKLLPVDILSFDHLKELRTWELSISSLLTTPQNLKLWNYWHLVFWPLLRT